MPTEPGLTGAMDASESAEPRYPIRVAARRAGLTPATVRAWERRYGAITPARSGTDRRLYSEADIERLRLLRAVADTGRSVADVAGVSTAQLRALVVRPARGARLAGSEPSMRDALLRACDVAVRAMDAPRLQTLLGRAAVMLPPRLFLQRIVVPLLRRVGRLWASGEITTAHEHAASVAVRQVLGWMLETFHAANDARDASRSDASRGDASRSETAPTLVAATPAGERHEFGALMIAVLAAAAGWRVAYLGADLPARDIAAAARDAGARVVALSLIAPAADAPDGTVLEAELRALRHALGDDVALLVGGTGADGQAGLLAALGADRPGGIGALGAWLAERGGETTA